jgi:ankyrin repeat protein
VTRVSYYLFIYRIVHSQECATPLIRAASNGGIEIVQMLLKAGADTSAANKVNKISWVPFLPSLLLSPPTFSLPPHLPYLLLSFPHFSHHLSHDLSLLHFFPSIPCFFLSLPSLSLISPSLLSLLLSLVSES